MHQSVLISCTEQNLLGLEYSRRTIRRGMICGDLGYPIGLKVSHMELIERISKKLDDKFIYSRSQF